MTTPLTRAVARLLLPTGLVVALGILVKGYAETGDGFAAGVVAGLCVLLQYTAFGAEDTRRRLPVRLAPGVAFAGLLVALLVAFVPPLAGDELLTHHPRPGAEVVHVGSLELLTAVAFDVGVFLVVLGASVGVVDVAAASRRRPR